MKIKLPSAENLVSAKLASDIKKTKCTLRTIRDYVKTSKEVDGRICFNVNMGVNNLIDGYGVEYIDEKDLKHRNSGGLEYINQGDPYRATVLHYVNSSVWFIGCWGDKVK